MFNFRNGFTTIFKGSLSLSYGKMGELLKTGEFFMVYSEVPNMSEYNAEYAAKFPSNRKGSPDDETAGNGQGGKLFSFPTKISRMFLLPVLISLIYSF